MPGDEINGHDNRSSLSLDMQHFVLIPSSSGLSYYTTHTSMRYWTKCLNPFFIRSQLLPGKHQPLQPYHVLIPSSSGLSYYGLRNPSRSMLRLNSFFIRSQLLQKVLDASRGRWGLNPFFIRSQLLRMFSDSPAFIERLNPFFIRSQLLLEEIQDTLSVSVLIPSSSGLSYYSTPCFSRYRS